MFDHAFTFFLLYNADRELQIGYITQQKANSLLQGGSIDPRDHSLFYDAVTSFFERAVEYSFKSLPLDDELLNAATFLNFGGRINANFLQVEYFINR